MSEESRAFVDSLYAETVATEDRIFGESYYGPFLNWGYWKSDTIDQIEACKNLVDLVTSGVPLGKQLLDAGSGLGGLAEYLHGKRPDHEITGINIRRDQIEAAQRRVPEARFLEMDATAMAFEAGSFDTVLCVEAAFHFPSRAAFLKEALRVLRPGGHLAMADIVSVPFPEEESAVLTPTEYQNLLYRLGFTEVRVSDVTRETAWGHAAHGIAFLRERRAVGLIDETRCAVGIQGRMARAAACRHYVTVAARKPTETRNEWAMGEAYLAELRRQLIATASS